MLYIYICRVYSGSKCIYNCMDRLGYIYNVWHETYTVVYVLYIVYYIYMYYGEILARNSIR